MSCMKMSPKMFESPANPEPSTSIGQLLVRASFVEFQAQDSLVEGK